MNLGASVVRNEIKNGSDDEDERDARMMAYNTGYGMRGGARLTQDTNEGYGV